jgi:hypothetical protein
MEPLEQLAETQGVLAIRNGEMRQYHQTPPANLDNVFAVAVVKVPLPPEPHSEGADPMVVIAAGIGKERKWGWLAVEKDTRQLIAAELVDEVNAVPGQWYFLRLYHRPAFLKDRR